jgi:hypothetical protein
MLAILPLVSFLFLFLIISNYDKFWRSSILFTALVLGSFLAVITEILSLFKLINFGCLLGIWGLLSLSLIWVYFRIIRQNQSHKLGRVIN